MRSPLPAETPINMRRRSQWQRRFEGYRFGITDARLSEWIAQFDTADQSVAARILDVVEFVSAEHIDAAFRSLLNRIPGWNRNKSKRKGRFAFVAFSRTAGESGDSMLHKFRMANNLGGDVFNELFIGRSDLVRSELGSDDTVVFLDDFVGSGNQAVRAWRGMFQELTAGIGSIYLVAVASFVKGANRIKDETGMKLLCHRNLINSDSILHEHCAHFSNEEKAKILHYCRKASIEKPWGYGDCGLVIVMSHQCPNNTLAMLHQASGEWEPLFPRS